MSLFYTASSEPAYGIRIDDTMWLRPDELDYLQAQLKWGYGDNYLVLEEEGK